MTDDERRAIEADCERLIKLYVNLNDAQDWPAVAALYTEDAVFRRPSAPIVISMRNSLRLIRCRCARWVENGAISRLVSFKSWCSIAALSPLTLSFSVRLSTRSVPLSALNRRALSIDYNSR
jgi:hypothetical protein